MTEKICCSGSGFLRDPQYFQNAGIGFKSLEESGLCATFMPEIAAERLARGTDSPAWLQWFCSRSVRAAGTVKEDQFVVYSHRPCYVTDPANMSRIIVTKVVNGEARMIDVNASMLDRNGAARIHQDAFEEMLDMVDNKSVFKVRYDDLMHWPPALYGIDRPTEEHMKKFHGKIGGIDMIVRNHPILVPFFSGESQAQSYLQAHKEVYGDVIEIFSCDDMLNEKGEYKGPLARLLCIGGGCIRDISGKHYHGGNILESCSLLGDCKFLVRQSSEGLGASK